MAKKGVIEEIFNKAKYVDDPESYRIVYRDFENMKETTLPKFLVESNNFQTIPSNRIMSIKKNNTILFEKIKKEDD